MSDRDYIDLLRGLGERCAYMTHGDPDDPEAVTAKRVVEWAIGEIERLRQASGEEK